MGPPGRAARYPLQRKRTEIMDEASGWMWFVIDVIAVGLLGLALAYGI
jgi:hypothetical protein